MSCISLPEKIYFKQGCLPVALDELKDKQRAFIIGCSKAVETKLSQLRIQHVAYFGTPENCIKEIKLFEPDVIIAVGGKSEIDLGQSASTLYDKKVCLVVIPTEEIDGAELHGDMVIIDRSENLPSFRSVFQEMFE